MLPLRAKHRSSPPLTVRLQECTYGFPDLGRNSRVDTYVAGIRYRGIPLSGALVAAKDENEVPKGARNAGVFLCDQVKGGRR